MAANWKRTFDAPLHAQGGRTIRTLLDANKYLQALEREAPGILARAHWQNAGKHLIAAAEGGDLAAARFALYSALVIGLHLDWHREPTPERRRKRGLS